MKCFASRQGSPVGMPVASATGSGHIGPMPQAIRIAQGPDGSLAYAISLPPEAMPPVRPRDLAAAWSAAREAADAGAWGPARFLRFARADGSTTDLALADADAACWAEAVDLVAGLASLSGMALCLRLLALVEVMGRARWMAGLFAIGAEGAELHPALLRAAAEMPLDAGARFDEAALRRLLSLTLPAGSPR